MSHLHRHVRPRLDIFILIIALLVGTCASARAGGGVYGLGGIRLLVETGDSQIDLAERYALAVLGADYNGTTHIAAANYYTNPWVRDSYAWGMIPSVQDTSLASYGTVELQYWLAHQQPFGGWVTARRSGWFDETPILISAVLDAYRVTGDLRTVRRALPRLERGWRWLAQKHVRPSFGSAVLIYANVPPHTAADWVDQVARSGYATQLEALWYWATRSLSVMEALTHRRTLASYYEAFAAQIKLDINRLLWTGKAPYVRDAQQVGPFGHYRSWLGPRDYFELDSNFLCILYGIADRVQAESIDRFVDVHAGYLLGFGSPTGVPARVVYGDYAPQDYAGKHERLGPGRYQSAYWPTVGVLVALGLAHSGQIAEARAIIQRLSAAFVDQGDIHEWYTADGTGEGAPAFGWAARMFVVALYAAYLGLTLYDNLPDQHGVAGIDLHNPLGPGATVVSFHGRMVRVQVQGGGSHVGVEIGGHVRRTPLLPGPLLCAGCMLRVVWGG